MKKKIQADMSEALQNDVDPCKDSDGFTSVRKANIVNSVKAFARRCKVCSHHQS